MNEKFFSYIATPSAGVQTDLYPSSSGGEEPQIQIRQVHSFQDRLCRPTAGRPIIDDSYIKGAIICCSDVRRIVNILLSTVEPLIINAALGVQAPTVPKSYASRGCNYCGNNGGVACFMSIDSITAAKTDDEAPVSIFLESNSAFCYSCMCTIL